ncbi:MAG: hypothetical protein M9938_09580 [Solirubrobacterales bacterium]|nr:hypothetical protein [Solirubrobacterales bacterium]
MRAEYDSEADALSIELIDAERWNGAIWIDDDYCHIATENGVPANIELLSPKINLGLLDRAAPRAQVSSDKLIAAARCAIEAADRTVSIDFSEIHSPGSQTAA